MWIRKTNKPPIWDSKDSYVILKTTKSAKSTNCISGVESRNVTGWLHALTTDSGKWLDVYRRRPQGLELDLLEYGNPTQHQRGRDKKLTYGNRGGGHAPIPPLWLRPCKQLARRIRCSSVLYPLPHQVALCNIQCAFKSTGRLLNRQCNPHCMACAWCKQAWRRFTFPQKTKYGELHSMLRCRD